MNEIMKKDFDNKLQSRNIKPTAMRQLVLQVLTDQKTAISLPELENKFEKADKTTLYRTLKTFEENKLIHSIDDGTGSVKYALCREACKCHPEDLHVHFLCAVCGQTYCLNDIPIPNINLPAKFQLESVNMVVKGVCSNCDK
jgi:Fur family ferric uptake transcriptional regulator